MTVAGVVLAGGRSRRFGRPKLDAEVDGQTLLDRAIEAVAEVASTVVVALGPSGSVAIRASIERPLILTRDPIAGAGPLAGVATALQVALDGGHDRAIVVAGDMPWLASAVLRAMLAALDDPAVLGAAAIVGGGPRPLPCAVDVPAGLAAATIGLDVGERSLRAWLGRLAVDYLPESTWRPLDPHGATFRDVDLPGDLAADPPTAPPG
jgi:molybdopterin-guanine dinucleotide biosynthesis protein A